MRMLPFCTALWVLALSCQTLPPDSGSPAEPESDRGKASVFTTNTATLRFQESQTPVNEPVAGDAFNVTLTGKTFQTVDGFGLAITQASCYNLLQMPEQDRKAFLEEMFSRTKGVGSSLVRVCIGGSDFSLDEFTWCDQPGMEHFAVHALDKQYLFPILDQIYAINPDVKIIASPWSCPRWMKMGEDGSLPYDKWTGGRLNPLRYQDYAQYFVKWIQEMENRGYHIQAVTLQNEPLNRGNSMSLYMPWEDQLEFIKTAVGPAFREAGIKARILLFDHNYNYDNMPGQYDYPLHIYDDAAASQYVAGSAWHNYGGNVTTLDRIVEKAPDKEIYFTEASIGTWNYDYEKCIINDFRDIFLGTLARGGKGVTLWNLMLDDKRSPYRPGGCSTCFGAVTISSSSYSYKSISRNTHYYQVAHCSKVLKPGAVRLETKGYQARGFTYQVYRNPDGSYAALMLNENKVEARLNLVTGQSSVTCKVPPMAIQSVIWNE